MSEHIKTTLILALTLLSKPISAALCPSFTLTADAPGEEWDGQPIIQSGRSTYLSNEAPIAPDAIATFFRNDTTHLYATNFNVSYMSEHETGPFILTTLNDGFPLFDNDPTVNFAGIPWSAETFNVTDDGYVGYVPLGTDGFASNDSSIGGWWVCYEASPPTLAQVAEVQLGTAAGTSDLVADSNCVQALFKITDVNVTAAPFC